MTSTFILLLITHTIMNIIKTLGLPLLLILLLSSCDKKSNNDIEDKTKPIENGYSAIFGGGPFYSGGNEVIDDLRNSGFNTVILWTIHIGENGNMNFNNQTIIDENGNYIGDPEWKTRLARLQEQPSSVDRIEIGIGAWGAKSWANIKSLIASEGIGSDTKLYKAFQLLQEITGATAINYDDEVTFDVESTVQFSLMLDNLGYKIGLCPFNEANYWKSVYEQVEAKKPGAIDRVYLQCYSGGSQNEPSQWNQYFGDIKVSYGLWSKNGNNCSQGDNPDAIKEKITAQKENISGGFIWLYDDIQKCQAYGSTSSYAKAINEGLQ